MLRELPTTIDNERVPPFKNTIADTDIKSLHVHHADRNTDHGFNIMQGYSQRFFHIDAVYAQDFDTAVDIVGGASIKQMIKRLKKANWRRSTRYIRRR